MAEWRVDAQIPDKRTADPLIPRHNGPDQSGVE